MESRDRGVAPGLGWGHNAGMTESESDSGSPWAFFVGARHLGTDACGNEIFAEENGGDTTVLGLSHDPPEVIVLAENPDEWQKLGWRNGDHLDWQGFARREPVVPLSKDDASRDILGDWLAGLPAAARIFDLTGCAAGASFDWSKGATFFRHPSRLAFALVPRERRGLFACLSNS